MLTFRTILCGFAALSVAACGGTSPGQLDVDNSLDLDADSIAVSDITFAMATVDGTVSRGTGVLDREASAFVTDSFSGDYDATTGIITLEDGGQATLSDLQDFSGTILIESAGGTRFGIFGVTPTQMPSGQVTYSGTTNLAIVDADGVYELSGEMLASVNFASGANDIAVTLSNLDGTKTAAFGTPQGAVTNVAEITLDVSGIGTDGGFSATNGISLTSTTLTAPLTGNEVVVHEGNFFGPAYDEMGAAFVISDSNTGSLEIYGTYLGD